jgi:hypothetical protein
MLNEELIAGCILSPHAGEKTAATPDACHAGMRLSETWLLIPTSKSEHLKIR